jgi:prepilin-type N-terminal cleavage/methylation domain-containing protein
MQMTHRRLSLRESSLVCRISNRERSHFRGAKGGNSRAFARRGLSLLEVMISTVLVGVCLVAALRALGMTLFTQTGMTDDAVAACLAEDLLYEVLQKHYSDPSGDSALQVDGDEAAEQKSSFDDVDDYHGWQENPPQDESGQAIPGFDDWTRSVRVELVEPADPTKVSASDQGLKRITVEVVKGGKIRATRSGLRANYDS